MAGPRFRLTLLTTWWILLKTNAVFLKLKNRQRRPSTLKERNRRLNRVLLITNLIILLFLMIVIHASALTTLSSPFDSSPFSFDKPHFCPDLSSGEKPASLVDRKDTGETTAPISFLQEDQISLPSDVFDFEKSSDSCLFKVGSLREHFDFWSNSIRASDFIISTIVEGYRIPFFDLPENFVIPNRSSAFKFKDFVNEAISELSVVVSRKFLFHQSLPILSTLCSSPVGNAGLFWTFRIFS